MKKSVLIVGLALLSFFFQTCGDEDSTKTTGNIQFTFRASDLDQGGGWKLSELPEGSVLMVSISSATAVVCTLKELPLAKHEDHYISDPLSLPYGHYSIIDFIVADADHQVLYATPKAGSSMASLVEHPLPMAFSVGKVEVADVEAEIVSVETHEAEDLGYASFEISIVDVESFKLAAYALNEDGNFALSGAQLFILHGDDTVHSQYVHSIVNTIFFDSEPDEFYTVVLIEPSFAKYTKTFQLHDLNGGFIEDLLSIKLEPAFTVVVDPYLIEGGYQFRFEVWNNDSSVQGKIRIDWGDGTIEEVVMPHGCCPEQSHFYSSGGPRFVSVYGDLDIITQLFINYDNPIKSISLRQLKELRVVSIVETPTPETIDISYNLKLETAGFGLTWVKSLDISKNIHLKNLFLIYMTDFSDESMNQIIADMYQHANDYHQTEGWITLVDADGGHIGPLTEQSVDRLYALQRRFGWTVEPPLEWLNK